KGEVVRFTGSSVVLSSNCRKTVLSPACLTVTSAFGYKRFTSSSSFRHEGRKREPKSNPAVNSKVDFFIVFIFFIIWFYMLPFKSTLVPFLAWNLVIFC